MNFLSRRRFIKKNNFDAIVMGASAGGIETLRNILEKIKEPYPLPIIIVQHIGSSGKTELSNFFNDICELKVKEAEDKEVIVPGVIYFAPTNYHIMIESDRSFSFTVEEHVNYARPSIDVLFTSAAEVYKERLLGILLTGANHDGAQGMKDIKDYGGTIIVEDPSSAKVPIMPQSAINIITPDLILSVDRIQKLVLELHKGNI